MTLIPEGLVLLMSVTFAVAAVRLAKRDTLIQQMSATESLASVDTICVDKTGTLTEGELRLDVVIRRRRRPGGRAPRSWDASRRAPATATRPWRRSPSATPGPGPGRAEVPFSSEWKWSGVSLAGNGAGAGTFVIGAPDILEEAGALVLPPGMAAKLAEETAAGRRVVAFGQSGEALPADAAASPAPRLARSR